MARFRLAARAAADLDEIWFTITPDNIDAADRVIDGLHTAAELLAAELRSFVTKTPYIIYYKPAPDGIVIARILHHARDVEATFPRTDNDR